MHTRLVAVAIYSGAREESPYPLIAYGFVSSSHEGAVRAIQPGRFS
jgi:hypothetical protein